MPLGTRRVKKLVHAISALRHARIALDLHKFSKSNAFLSLFRCQFEIAAVGAFDSNSQTEH